METAVVKQATGRFAAECLPSQVTQTLIFKSAAKAIARLVEGDVPDPFVLDVPVRVAVEFFTSDMAYKASMVPFTQWEGTRVSFSTDEMAMAYSAFRSMVMLAVD
jgi:D-aminopeptidase